ncbi:hypothetical protein Pfo_009497 [Paulownia fortunei]|nr:hypothetical protein Pfo_009497 [Paulownia fortunei]
MLVQGAKCNLHPENLQKDLCCLPLHLRGSILFLHCSVGFRISDEMSWFIVEAWEVYLDGLRKKHRIVI